MSDTAITIFRPLELRIELDELDDISFLAEVTFQRNEPGSTVGGSTSIWFGKSEWLAFIRSLRSFYFDHSPCSATLSDISKDFVLHVERRTGGFFFSLEFQSYSTGSDLELKFKYSETVDDDVFGAFRSAFEDFPLWKGENIGD